jgi:hypothetical protein
VKGMLWISGIIPDPDRGTILNKFFDSVPDPTLKIGRERFEIFSKCIRGKVRL